MKNLLSELTPPPKSNSSDAGLGEFVFIVFIFIVAVIIFGLIVEFIISRLTRNRKKVTTQDDGLNEVVGERVTDKKVLSESNEDRIYRGFGSFFVRLILKLALIAGIIIFGLCNYRLLSFNKGWTKNEMSEDASITEIVLTLTGVSKMEYYNAAPVPFSSDTFLVYVETSQKNYIFSTDADGIDALSAAGLFSKSLRPQKITPVPFYVEIILIIVVLAVPFRRRRKRIVVLD